MGPLFPSKYRKKAYIKNFEGGVLGAATFFMLNFFACFFAHDKCYNFACFWASFSSQTATFCTNTAFASISLKPPVVASTRGSSWFCKTPITQKIEVVELGVLKGLLAGGLETPCYTYSGRLRVRFDQGRKNSININFLVWISCRHSWPLRPDARVKKFLPITGAAEKRTFWCGRPRFSVRTSMTRRVLEKLWTKKFELMFGLYLKRAWENRCAFNPSHSGNQSGEPAVLEDSLRTSPSTVCRAILESNRESRQYSGTALYTMWAEIWHTYVYTYTHIPESYFLYHFFAFWWVRNCTTVFSKI